MILKTKSNRYRAKVKHHQVVVADKTFDLRRDAVAYEAAQKMRVNRPNWIDPKLGREKLGLAVARFLEDREGRISAQGFTTESSLLTQHIIHKKKFAALSVGNVLKADVEDIYLHLLKVGKDNGDGTKSGLSVGSVKRFKSALSVFFSWTQSELIRADNPVIGSKIPSGVSTAVTHEVYPYSQAELYALHRALQEHSPQQADIALVLGLTGLRVGELTALRVRDVMEVPTLAFRVVRSASDGYPIQSKTKGDKITSMRVGRTVPVADDLREIIARARADKLPDDLLFTAPQGGRLNKNNWRRAVHWDEHKNGRRIHDLRHTAATLWFTAGIAPKTVQTWLGHSSMTVTVDTYAHFMGDDADRAGLERLNNSLRDAAGTRRDHEPLDNEGGGR